MVGKRKGAKGEPIVLLLLGQALPVHHKPFFFPSSGNKTETRIGFLGDRGNEQIGLPKINLLPNVVVFTLPKLPALTINLFPNYT